MGSRSCCANEGLNRGAWTAMEDEILTNYISVHGEGKWKNISINTGLKRCCKSCRLRWLNYLKPGIKRGNITSDEEDLIIRLHKLLGNRWTLIAGRLPGRTDNEIKNYWNSNIKKRLQDGHPTHEPHLEDQKKFEPSSSSIRHHDDPQNPQTPSYVFRPKATRCTKVVIPEELQNKTSEAIGENIVDMDSQIFSELEPLHYPQQQNGGQPILSPNWNDNMFFQQWNFDEGTSN